MSDNDFQDCKSIIYFCFRCGPAYNSRSGDRDKSLSLISIEIILFNLYRCRTEEPPLGGPDPRLWPPFSGHFRDKIFIQVYHAARRIRTFSGPF
jgi:hypothetical protein